MLLLPRTIGPLTLTHKLGTSSVEDSYAGTLVGELTQPVVARHILPYLARDPAWLEQISARVRDLLGVRHPFLVRVRDWLEDGEDRFVLEDHVDGISLELLLQRCREQGLELPHNVYLNFATQLCNGLEALHGRPGKGSGVDNVLHLRLRPSAVHVTREGKVVLGGYGLVRSPTVLPHADGTSSPVPVRLEHLSPEQTRPDEPLAPTSDIFSLGALLYEMLTLEPLFRAQSNLKTIQRIQAAEIGDELSIARARMPGLDKILQRALTAEARLRYQRAFVLREDLRGLMANYSFSTIVQDTRQFLEAFIRPEPGIPPLPPPPGLPDEPAGEALPPISTESDGEPESTAEIAARALARRQEVTLADEEESLPPLPLPIPTITPGEDDEYYEDDLDLAEISDALDPPTRDEEALPPPPYEDFEADPDSIILPAEAPAPAAPRTLAAPVPLPPPLLPPLPVAPAAEVKEDAPEADEPEHTSFTGVPLPPPVLPPLPEAPAAASPEEAPAPEPARPLHRPPHIATKAPPPAAASPRAAPAPLPAPAPAAPQSDADEEEDWKPRRAGGSSTLLFGVAALVGIVVCGGGGYGLLTVAAHLGTTARSSGAVAVSTPPAEAPAEPTPAPDPEAADPQEAVAAVTPPPEPAPAPAEAPQAERPAVASTAGSDDDRGSTTARTEPRAPAAERPVSTVSTVSTASTGRQTSASRSSSDDDDALSFLRTETPAAPQEEPVATLAASALDLERYASLAERGALGRTEMMALESVGLEDSNYTRTRALLLMDAQRRGDASASQRYLDQLMRKPENRYNPIYLTDAARLKVNRGDYKGALEEASLAERHWARLPSDLIFLKKAEIYEIQAAAYQGLFYASEDDMDLLLKSIRSWERYRDHVNSRARSDMASRAERELTKLEDIRRRLE